MTRPTSSVPITRTGHRAQPALDFLANKVEGREDFRRRRGDAQAGELIAEQGGAMARTIRREDDPKPFLPELGRQARRHRAAAWALPDRPIKIKSEAPQVPQRPEDRARPGMSHAILSISSLNSLVRARPLLEKISTGSSQEFTILVEHAYRTTNFPPRAAGRARRRVANRGMRRARILP